MNPLQLLNALSAGGTSKGMSYEQVKMNGNGVEAMLDTGATTILLMKEWSNNLV